MLNMTRQSALSSFGPEGQCDLVAFNAPRVHPPIHKAPPNECQRSLANVS